MTNETITELAELLEEAADWLQTASETILAETGDIDEECENADELVGRLRARAGELRSLATANLPLAIVCDPKMPTRTLELRGVNVIRVENIGGIDAGSSGVPQLDIFDDDTSIYDRRIELSVRAGSVAERAGCKTVGDLRRISDEALLATLGCRPRTVIEIREWFGAADPEPGR